MDGGWSSGGAAAGTDRPAGAETAQPGSDRLRGDPADLAAGYEANLEGDNVLGQGRIRGRGAAPGRKGGAHSALDSGHPHARASRGAASIRGHPEVPGAWGAAKNTAEVGGAGDKAQAKASKEQRRLDARNAHLATSLGAHAERVLKRDAAGDRPSVPSPAERLAALRRRIAGRGLADNGAAIGVEEDSRSDKQKATDTAGAAEPETGLGHQGPQTVGTKEVLKMHQRDARAYEFTMSTACVDGHNVDEGASRSCTVGAAVEEHPGHGHVDLARAAAARMVAWHTAADLAAPARGAER